MKSRISLAGLLSGALMAVVAGLLLSRYSFVWLLLGVAAGIVMGPALAQRGQPESSLRKGEER